MRSYLLLVLAILLSEGQFVPTAFNKGSAGGTPTLVAYYGKVGMAKNTGGTAGQNAMRFSLDPSGYPLAVTSGSLVLMSGIWPNNPTTSNGYHANCTTPCAPTMTDNTGSNTWSAVFTAGNTPGNGGCLDAQGFDHGFYYAANAASGTATVTETHAVIINNTAFDISNWYNIATSSATDGSSCAIDITPANNTAPNISGTAFSTGSDGDLIVVSIDVESIPISNPVTGFTVPSGCTLLNNSITQTTQIGYGVQRVTEYCIQATHGSFTPSFTVAQSAHDTFTIYAAAFKQGSGGSAPTSTAAAVLMANQVMPATAGTYKVNMPCPAATKSIVVTDDSYITGASAVTDSNSDTFTQVPTSPTSQSLWYSLNVTSIANSNTFTISLVASGGGQVLATMYCTTATSLDTGVTAVTGTQVTTSTVSNSCTQSGSGNCGGASGTLVTGTALPTLTPGETNDLFISVAGDGVGPVLNSTQPSGVVLDFVTPSTLANCSNCDAVEYSNGNMGAHYWTSGTGSINFGWQLQQNAASVTFQFTGFH